MSTTQLEMERTSDRNLEKAVEPLANYICAADRPREALRTALAALFNEVQETNQAARAHFLHRRADSLGLI